MKNSCFPRFARANSFFLSVFVFLLIPGYVWNIFCKHNGFKNFRKIIAETKSYIFRWPLSSTPSLLKYIMHTLMLKRQKFAEKRFPGCNHRQKSRTFCSRIHWSAEYVILQWDKNKMAARTSKTDQGRDKFHTKY